MEVIANNLFFMIMQGTYEKPVCTKLTHMKRRIMKVLILAAGKGTRISRYLSGNPKCTVDVGGKPLILYTVEMMMKKGITDIAIVLGYRSEVIKKIFNGYNVKYYFNPFYDVTNSIASAWFAHDYLMQYDDTLIMNGDVYLEEILIDKILDCKKSPVMFADSSRKQEADYKFKYEHGKLCKYGKELEGSDISGEYIGIGKFAKDFMPDFVSKMNKLIMNQNHSIWWEDIIYSMVEANSVFVEEINDLFWAEVDYVEDYDRILKFCGYEADFRLSIKKRTE